VPRNSRYFSREKAARREDLLAAIGRGLREHYAGAQPLSDRLTELLKQIKRSTGEREAQVPASSSKRPYLTQQKVFNFER
jgi:hypothetical protein